MSTSHFVNEADFDCEEDLYGLLNSYRPVAPSDLMEASGPGWLNYPPDDSYFDMEIEDYDNYGVTGPLPPGIVAALRLPGAALSPEHAATRRALLAILPRPSAEKVLDIYGLDRNASESIMPDLRVMFGGPDGGRDAYIRMACCYVDWMCARGSDTVFTQWRRLLTTFGAHAANTAAIILPYMIATMSAEDIARVLGAMSGEGATSLIDRELPFVPNRHRYDRLLHRIAAGNTFGAVPPLDTALLVDAEKRSRNLNMRPVVFADAMARSLYQDYLYPRAGKEMSPMIPAQQLRAVLDYYLAYKNGAVLSKVIANMYTDTPNGEDGHRVLNKRCARELCNALADGRAHTKYPMRIHRLIWNVIGAGQPTYIEAIIDMGIVTSEQTFNLLKPVNNRDVTKRLIEFVSDLTNLSKQTPQHIAFQNLLRHCKVAVGATENTNAYVAYHYSGPFYENWINIDRKLNAFRMEQHIYARTRARVLARLLN